MKVSGEYGLGLLAGIVSVLLLSACGTPNQASEANRQVEADGSRKDANSPTFAAKGSENIMKAADDQSASTRDSSVSGSRAAANLQSKSGDSICFTASKQVVDQEDHALLLKNAIRLKQHRRLVLTLRVHSDNRGSRTYNLARAEQWTNSIRDALRTNGVAERQVRVEFARYRGASSTCSTADCSLNWQCVELIYKQ